MPQAMPIKITNLSNNNRPEQEDKIENVLDDIADINSLKDSQIKELHRKLVAKGITTDTIIDKYKWFLDQKPKYVRASDVLKALERMERLMGLDDKDANQLQIRAMIQHKSASEITTTLIEITGKTQEYLRKLEERKDE